MNILCNVYHVTREHRVTTDENVHHRRKVDYDKYKNKTKAKKLGAAYKGNYPDTYTVSQTKPNYRKQRAAQIRELERLHYVTGMPHTMALGVLRKKYKKKGIDFLPNWSYEEKLSDDEIDEIARSIYNADGSINHKSLGNIIEDMEHMLSAGGEVDLMIN